MFTKKEIDLNLRTEPDFWVKSIGRFAWTAWCLALASLFGACLAIPAVRTLLYIHFGLKVDGKWLKLLYQIDFGLLVATFVVSGTGLLINSLRHRRRTDHYNTSLIFLTILTALCIIGYLILISF